jgi:methylglyoxal synthase
MKEEDILYSVDITNFTGTTDEALRECAKEVVRQESGGGFGKVGERIKARSVKIIIYK